MNYVRLLLMAGIFGVSLADYAEAQTPPSQEKPAALNQGSGVKFVLRRSFRTASLFDAKIDGKGAEIAIKQNKLTGVDVFDVNGALILGWRRNLSGMALTRFAYSFGVFGQIHDVSKVDVKDRVDKLGIGVGMAWIQSDKHLLSVIKHAVLETDASWLTDSDGDLSVLTASASYQPFFGKEPKETFSLTEIGNKKRWRGKVSADYFKVIDDAGLKEYSSSSDYLYLGAGLGFDYHVINQETKKVAFKLSGDYQLQYDVVGDGETSEYFELGATMPLSGSDGVAVALSYKKGQRPKGKGEIDQFSMGLEFKF